METDAIAPGPGNGTAILVPSQGISIVSDIDDVLRITKVYVPTTGLFNSFVNPYVNIEGIPELFASWEKKLPNASFHYDTTTPVQLTRTYVDYLFSNFPLGSLEMRPINISDPSQILDARQDSLLKLFQTFPQRKFGTSHFLLFTFYLNGVLIVLCVQCSSETHPRLRFSPPIHKLRPSSHNRLHASSFETRPRRTRTTSFPTTPHRSRTSPTARTSSIARRRVRSPSPLPPSV